MSRESAFSRRDFVRSAVSLGAACAIPRSSLAMAGLASPKGRSPIRLGLASYTFRNFTRAQLIAFMKRINAFELNAKDVKDHLPVDPQEEKAALMDYTAAGIKLHAAGTISLAKDDDADMRMKFEYCKRAAIGVMVAGDPTLDSLPRIEKFVKEYDIRIAIHNHGPEDKLWHSPLDVLKAVKRMDARIGCCIDVGHTVRAGVDVVRAIHETGPRLFNVHMKDLANFQDKDSQVAVGEGRVPVRGMFDALSAIQYEGFVDLEYEVHPDEPLPGVIASFAYMRGLLAGVGHPSNR